MSNDYLRIVQRTDTDEQLYDVHCIRTVTEHVVARLSAHDLKEAKFKAVNGYGDVLENYNETSDGNPWIVRNARTV